VDALCSNASASFHPTIVCLVVFICFFIMPVFFSLYLSAVLSPFRFVPLFTGRQAIFFLTQKPLEGFSPYTVFRSLCRKRGPRCPHDSAAGVTFPPFIIFLSLSMMFSPVPVPYIPPYSEQSSTFLLAFRSLYGPAPRVADTYFKIDTAAAFLPSLLPLECLYEMFPRPRPARPPPKFTFSTLFSSPRGFSLIPSPLSPPRDSFPFRFLSLHAFSWVAIVLHLSERHFCPPRL